MTEDAIREALSPAAALGLTMWAEARGDWRQGDSSVEERIAVGCVIRTRARIRGLTPKQVCLERLQFSCWNRAGTDPNHLALLAAAEAVLEDRVEDRVLRETLYLAEGIVSGVIVDRTHAATHYYAPAAMVPPGRVPAWAVGHEPVARIGSQVFYRL